MGDERVVELVADGHAAGGQHAVRGEQQVARLLLQRAAAADDVLPPALDPRMVERVREVCGASVTARGGVRGSRSKRNGDTCDHGDERYVAHARPVQALRRDAVHLRCGA